MEEVRREGVEEKSGRREWKKGMERGSGGREWNEGVEEGNGGRERETDTYLNKDIKKRLPKE